MSASSDLVLRSHETPGTRSQASFSRCGTYRYALRRQWGQGGPLLFIMLNPSTADEMRNDPTIARCEKRARTLGFAGISIVNLFAYRATQPAILRHVADPVGPLNDDMIQDAAQSAAMVVCAWGLHGSLFGRGARVAHVLRAAGRPLHHLGTCRAGAPRHPLYLSSDQPVLPWVSGC